MNGNGRDNARRSWWLWQAPALAWFVLLILFGASLGSAYVPLGAGNLAINLAIAAIMIALLVIFLMDLKSATALIRIVAASGMLWLILMFALTFNDYLSRYY
jgi:cytochrome c oxidase subunit IV